MSKQKQHSVKLAPITLAILMIFASPLISAKKAGSSGGGSGGSHRVNGHFKKNGTYVAPHHATNPNHTQRDNYSSKPNVNPYNGKQGTKEPDH
jgi:hypothetical protein